MPHKREYSAEEKARRNANSRRWYQENKARAQHQARDWKAQNSERVKADFAAYYAKNREVLLAYRARHKMEKPELAREGCALRLAASIQATPPWADRAAIASVYADAVKVERETGVPHHVDHIVPLRGKTVCGLHVPWNLQPLPALDNVKKGNRLPDDDMAIALDRRTTRQDSSDHGAALRRLAA